MEDKTKFEIIKNIIAFCITKGIVIFIFVIFGAHLLKWYVNEYNATGDPTGLLIIAALIGSGILGVKLAKWLEER